VHWAPGIPHALISWANGFVKTRANPAARSRRHAVICEEPTGPAFGGPDDKLRDEAIQLCGPMDCFAEPVIGRRFAPTRWLAMTT